MAEQRPAKISSEDWQDTPPAVQAFIIQLSAEITAVQDQLEPKAQSTLRPYLSSADDAARQKQLLTNFFIHLRSLGFSLGIGELLAIFQAMDGGWGGDSLTALKEVAELLWCNSLEERREFDIVWGKIVEQETATAWPQAAQPPPEQLPDPDLLPGLAGEIPPPLPVPEPTQEEQEAASEWTTLPIQVPFASAPIEESRELNAYWPLSRRSMIYIWRYLRRPLPDGPANVLDVNSTVNEATRLGFFLSPIYRRRERNHAHLILLIDQEGSMVPFHRFTRDLVETAQHESSIETVDVFYFHNVPTTTLYLDPHMTKPVQIEQTLVPCTSDTSLLVVSDAGSARGYRHLPRIRTTTKFLAQLKRRTNLIAWLNPMPMNRWSGTSAKMIAALVPMFQMDPDGFSNAIDIVRGQPMQHYS